MRKYYTRACNFYYGTFAKNLIKNKSALALCGSKNIAFTNIEILSRDKPTKRINIKDIKKLPNQIKKNYFIRFKENNLKEKKFKQIYKYFRTINHGCIKSNTW